MTGTRLTRAAILGAGRMGLGIAQVFAAAGVQVDLYDPDPGAPEAARVRLADACAATGAELEQVRSRLRWRPGIAAAVREAQLVIEAGPERLAAKREIFAAAQAAARPDAILATNTSAIPIGRIAAELANPGQVVGTHFWNPPHLIPLVEVVRADTTDQEVFDATSTLLGEVGFRPVPVAADVPGFVGNRLQHALKREAIALVANGVCTAETVDTVVRLGFGRRLSLVGPLEQADLGGLDLTMAIHEVLMPDLDVTEVPHPLLAELVGRGDLGAKTGQGFFSWTPERAAKRRAEIDAGLLAQRPENARTT